MKIKLNAKAVSEKALGLFTKAIEGLEKSNELADIELSKADNRVVELKAKMHVAETDADNALDLIAENVLAIAAINMLLGKKEA